MNFIRSRVLIVSILTVISIGGFGFKYLNDKLNNMSNLVEAFKKSNVQLKQKNKALTSKNNKLSKTNKSLTKANQKFSKTNKSLIAKQKRIKNKMVERRKRVTLRNISRAKGKLATSGAKMAPFIGIPLIVGAISMDINDYCSDITEMEKMEYELFATAELKNTEHRICGVDIDKHLQNTANSVNRSYEDVLNSFNEYNHNASAYWGEKFNNTAHYFAKSSNATKQYILTVYSNTAQSLSNTNTLTKQFWINQYDNLMKFSLK